jgi:stage II sporulation protein D
MQLKQAGSNAHSRLSPLLVLRERVAVRVLRLRTTKGIKPNTPRVAPLHFKRRVLRRDPLTRALAILALFLLLHLPGCVQDTSPPPPPTAVPHIRVLLNEDADSASLTLFGPQILLDSKVVDADFPRGSPVSVSLAPSGWRIGNTTIPVGTLTFEPRSAEPIRVGDAAYRGAIRLIPTSARRFDVIDDLPVDDYLRGVVTREMYASWPIEAIKAQAVASRTYVLYEAGTTGAHRTFDVFSDQRSQVYGGMSGETAASQTAVDQTAGLVVTYGPGEGKIFRAYFSSCCGGVAQAAADAFPGDPYIPPLAEQYRGAICSDSKYFNWGPITLKKSEIARRFKAWSVHQAIETDRPVSESAIVGVAAIQIQGANRYGRPSRVLLTDSRGSQFSLAAETMRSAINFDPQGGPTLPSSFCKMNNANPDSITFYEGHGFGHGVGLCQYCAMAEARDGEDFIKILADSYPHAKLLRAY